VDLVEDNKLDITDKIRALVEHASQDLCRHLVVSLCARYTAHNQTAALGIDLDISGKNTNSGGVEGSLEVAELLVRQRLDGGGVDGPSNVS
jgi:hypothetical protein